MKTDHKKQINQNWVILIWDWHNFESSRVSEPTESIQIFSTQQSVVDDSTSWQEAEAESPLAICFEEKWEKLRYLILISIFFRVR